MTTIPKRTRAVFRVIEAGCEARCVHCDRQIVFRAKARARQAIVNVYWRGRWQRVEHFHEDCYLAAGEPYGEPDASNQRPVFTRPMA